MNLTERSGVALRYQVAALRREFGQWRERTAEHTPLEKHCSQVQKITAGLDALLDKAMAGNGTDAALANERTRTVVQGAHVLWDYFRSKLALRDVSWLSEDLRCVDELAWNCYEPALTAAGAAGLVDPMQLKEPPLTFFAADASPFARTRDKLITSQGISTDDADIFTTAVLSMPISVVAIPWFQLNYLPGAVVVAHEVGHAVANDLSGAMVAAGRPKEGVRQQIEAAVRQLDLSGRQAAWCSWCHELFADTYGILCCGPAAVFSLVEYLADTQASIEEEILPDPQRANAPDKGWGSYPTRALRMRFNFELLRQLAIADDKLERDWADAYGTSHAMPAFNDDIEKVAAKLLETKLAVFGNQPISAVVSFSPTYRDHAADVTGRINRDTDLPANIPFRAIFAGITQAYREDPEGFIQTYAEAKPSLASRLNRTIKEGVRSADQALPAAATQARDKAFERLADQLFELFAPTKM